LKEFEKFEKYESNTSEYGLKIFSMLKKEYDFLSKKNN